MVCRSPEISEGNMDNLATLLQAWWRNGSRADILADKVLKAEGEVLSLLLHLHSSPYMRRG